MPADSPPELLGLWTLRRRLVDRRVGQHGTVAGTLTLRPDGDAIRWSESGTLQWNGAQLPVTRELLLADGPDGWWMYFADGRPFHPWRPGVVVDHPCRADHYRGLVRSDGSGLRTVWDVTGPAKDQRIATRLRRTERNG